MSVYVIFFLSLQGVERSHKGSDADAEGFDSQMKSN